MITKRWSLLIAASTVLAAMPLFFTYQIKHALFPQGYWFVFMYSAGLLSVVAVPALLTIEAAVAFALRRSPEIARWHVAAMVVAIAAEATFLVARNL